MDTDVDNPRPASGMKLDAVIFGGGIAGLWLLDELRQRDWNVLLLEANQLGYGQTVASQGIIHGGLKYTLQGLLTPAAANIREMPGIWRAALAGQRSPDLSAARLRSPCCYLWRTDSVSSRLGLIGARFGLRVAPQSLSPEQRPAILRHCPGTVCRLEEQVLSAPDLLQSLASQHKGRILKIDPQSGLDIHTTNQITHGGRRVTSIRLAHPLTNTWMELHPDVCFLAAGSGNQALRTACGLPTECMQRRPLHMVLVRGPALPELNGHCVDGAKTRVTITSDRDAGDRTVWQIGGQLAEDGVELEPEALIRLARTELTSVIPGFDLTDTEWSTYRVDRAEGLDKSGRRPDGVKVMIDQNVISIWPTKLALAPIAAEEAVQAAIACRAAETTAVPVHRPLQRSAELTDWPEPDVAAAPWEEPRTWTLDSEFTSRRRRAA